MPILDHFSPPLSVERVWNTFHHAWAATIARLLNRRLLPEYYFAAPNVQFGPRVEIDVGTFEPAAAPASQGGRQQLYSQHCQQRRSSLPPFLTR